VSGFTLKREGGGDVVLMFLYHVCRFILAKLKESSRKKKKSTMLKLWSAVSLKVRKKAATDWILPADSFLSCSFFSLSIFLFLCYPAHPGGHPSFQIIRGARDLSGGAGDGPEQVSERGGQDRLPGRPNFGQNSLPRRVRPGEITFAPAAIPPREVASEKAQRESWP